MGLTYEQLKTFQKYSSSISFMTSFITDPIELLLICSAIFYISLNYFGRKTGERFLVTANIWLQLALMLGQSALFTARDIYMKVEGTKDVFRDSL